MLLGKRPRPPIKRTTSITEFTVDLSYIEDHHHMQNHQQQQDVNGFDRRLLATVSPRNPRRHSADFLDTAHFLRTCGLCKRRLAPTRDIYMYRGDTAFCSLDCRQQQMNQDELKEKCSVASNLEGLSGTTVESEASSKGGTITAP